MSYSYGQTLFDDPRAAMEAALTDWMRPALEHPLELGEIQTSARITLSQPWREEPLISEFFEQVAQHHPEAGNALYSVGVEVRDDPVLEDGPMLYRREELLEAIEAVAAEHHAEVALTPQAVDEDELPGLREVSFSLTHGWRGEEVAEELLLAVRTDDGAQYLQALGALSPGLEEVFGESRELVLAEPSEPENQRVAGGYNARTSAEELARDAAQRLKEMVDERSAEALLDRSTHVGREADHSYGR